MIQSGTVQRFGNKGFGFVKRDCKCVLIGNFCRRHSTIVFMAMQGMRFVEIKDGKVVFHSDPRFGRELLPEPKAGDRVVMLIGSNNQGLIATMWTFESLWNEAELLLRGSGSKAA